MTLLNLHHYMDSMNFTKNSAYKYYATPQIYMLLTNDSDFVNIAKIILEFRLFEV